RAFIRVGSCGALRADVRTGDVVICSAAVRLDGASLNWAPIEWPAAADWRVTHALAEAAKAQGTPAHPGIGVTTDCFNEGQARPDLSGYVPKRIKARHKELVRRGALFYAMEEAALFVWCSTHGGIPCGAINAVFANRITGEFKPSGEEAAARIALMAFALLRLTP
ncbi:MAG TPA: uridine phosphorylase, partial [Candidatus Eisenbacteria bacterium]|nr:uridine phosphorylase [Candidatus Eisenbacteria bacterium]